MYSGLSLATLRRLRDSLERIDFLESEREAAKQALSRVQGELQVERQRAASTEGNLQELKAQQPLPRLLRLLSATWQQPRLLLDWPAKLFRALQPGSSAFQARRLVVEFTALQIAEVELVAIASVDEDSPPLLALPVGEALPEDPKQLRVALICDRFTADSLSLECQALALHPDSWQAQIAEFQPHMLFVESAWVGLEGEWQDKVVSAGAELRSLVASCRQAGIPTVFWNKEDPLHFEAFLQTASLFEHVFTTDAESLFEYRRKLCHQRIGVLPFAVQPRLHHPFKKAGDERIAGSFFAGAWYGNLTERCRDFRSLAGSLALVGPFSIHDRNDRKGVPARQYPAEFVPYLRPAVAYEQTPSLYRNYKIGLSLNTIKQSSTMFARRALELICTNTSVYSNYSRALGLLFGDLLRVSDDGAEVLDWAWYELQDPDSPNHRQRRLQAMRKVLSEHTWHSRLHTVMAAVSGSSLPKPSDSVVVVSRISNLGQAHKLVQMAHDQHNVEVSLFVQAPDDLMLPPELQRLSVDALQASPGQIFAGRLVAVWHVEDAYGPYYLTDLVAAMRFDQGRVIGKACYFRSSQNDPVMEGAGLEYCQVNRLAWRRTLADAESWTDRLDAVLGDIDNGGFEGEGLLSIDRESYLQSATLSELPTPLELEQGISLAVLDAHLRQLMANMQASTAPEGVSGGELERLFKGGVLPARTSVALCNGALEVVSKLLPRQEDALFSGWFSANDLHQGRAATRLRLRAEASPAFELYLDAGNSENGQVLDRCQLLGGATHSVAATTDVDSYRFAVAIRGPYVGYWQGLAVEDSSPDPLILPGEGRLLVVVNGYPRAGDLYRNAFVHRRVKLYQARGINVDVVWVSSCLQRHSYAFDGVRVTVCDGLTLRQTLLLSGHSTIAVHFLDEEIWLGIEQAVQQVRTVVWLHGSEVQSWARRSYNFDDERARAEAQRSSNQRMRFWAGLFAEPPAHLRFVFVSQGLYRDACADIGSAPPPGSWQVIHNPIDTEIFRYRPKTTEHRLRVLSIRPHASRTYANDLVAEAISIMALAPEFEQMHFTLVGDGPLWDSNFSGLQQYENVSLQRRFVTQREAAELHADHGIFLVPTRGDSQGVSRDEAMASGLVPVTTDVGAVAEFVDDSCGVLCAAEDAAQLAAGCLALIRDVQRFSSLSLAAASRVGKQSAAELIAKNEIKVLGLDRRP